MGRIIKQTKFLSDYSRRSFSIYRNIQWTWSSKPNNNTKRNVNRVSNRHHVYIQSVIGITLLGFLLPTKALAESVGGVSATAAPVANSSGSVTNQAIQVLQGPYITNTYGGGIQCQGPTMNITPYVTGAVSRSLPYEPYYMDPVYDVTDFKGRFDEDGNAIGDGIPDNPGSIVYEIPVRTGQKDNYNLGLGFSMTWSRPLDKTLQDQCKLAAQTQIELQQQITANKRLDFEIARLKNCGELMKSGISFHPRSPYYKICADVVVQNVTVVPQHRHSIPRPTSSSSPSQTSTLQSLDSDPAALLGVPLQTRSSVVSPE